VDAAIQTAARGPLSGFLFRWLGTWVLTTALSSFLLALFYVLERHHGPRLVIFLGIAGVLSLPVLGGFLQGVVMRGLLRRSTLWGALTGGGIAIAAASTVVTVLNLRALWWPVAFRVALWVDAALGLARPPFDLVGAILASVLFGAILGVMQAIVLAPRWWSMAAWIATVSIATVFTGVWLYSWTFFGPVSALFTDIADLTPLTGEWRFLPASVLWAEVAALCFAVPTGSLMRQLLRRHQRTDAEALIRRFE
jgi:hypothetical protein